MDDSAYWDVHFFELTIGAGGTGTIHMYDEQSVLNSRARSGLTLASSGTKRR